MECSWIWPSSRVAQCEFLQHETMASSWDAKEAKTENMQSQHGVVQNKTIYMKVSTEMAELGYDQKYSTWLLQQLVIQLLTCVSCWPSRNYFIYSSVSSTIITFSFCCLSRSSTLSSTCSFAVSCKAANATATSRARAFKTDLFLYDNHVDSYCKTIVQMQSNRTENVFNQSSFNLDQILLQCRQAFKPDAVPALFTKQETLKNNQRPRQEKKDTQFCTSTTNLEDILSKKLLKKLLMVRCYCCVYVMFKTIATTT